MSNKLPDDLADLTASRIRRRNPSVSERAAREMSAELEAIEACVRGYFAAGPFPMTLPDGVLDRDVEEGAVQSLWRVTFDIEPDGLEACYEAMSVMEFLMLAGGEDLFLRYVRLYDRINGTNTAAVLEPFLT